jgi:MFS family permease
MLLVGGFGLAFPAMITLAMSAASASDAGVTSGLVNTTQQVGAALGVAVLSTLAAARTGRLVAHGEGMRAALTEGYRLAFGVGTGLALAALLIALVALLPAAKRRRSDKSLSSPETTSVLPERASRQPAPDRFTKRS